MVADFIDLRNWDAENLKYLVFSGFKTRPTLPASLLISTHNAVRAGRLLAITMISLAYPQMCAVCSKSYCIFPCFLVLCQNEVEQCCRQIIYLRNPSMTKGLLIFPSTITLACSPSSKIFTSRSIILDIQKLASDSRSLFWFMLSKALLKSLKWKWSSIKCA